MNSRCHLFRCRIALDQDGPEQHMAREAVIGESGQVIKAPRAGGRGMARFSIPILGSDEWEIISEEPVEIGDRIVIRDFSGNTLVVGRG